MTENKDIDNNKKIFVGGLNVQTTEESMRTFYEKWGEVVECKVMMDRVMNRSKCFGFVTFRQAETVGKCLADKPHIIDGKQVDAKVLEQRLSKGKKDSVKKIFVGGTRELTENDIRDFFSKYGNITHFNMVSDKLTGKNKGFCFVTFDETDSPSKVNLIGYHHIGSVRVEVKESTENLKRHRDEMQQNMSGGFPGQDYYQQYPSGYMNMQGGYYPNHPSMWNNPAMWNQAGTAEYPLGAQYENGNGGGAMKGPKRAKLSEGPYTAQQPAAYGGTPYANPAAAAQYANQAATAQYANPAATAQYSYPPTGVPNANQFYGSQAPNPAYGYDAGSQAQK